MSGSSYFYLPADEAIGQALTTQLTVTGGITEAGSGVASYEFLVTGVTVAGYSADSGWMANNSFAPNTVSPLTYGYTYAWQVRARDYVGNVGSWYGPQTFTLVPPCQRNKPTITLLQGNLISTTITSEGGTQSYTLTIRNNDDGGCSDTTFTLTPEQTDFCVANNLGYSCFDTVSMVPSSVTLSPTSLSNPAFATSATVTLTAKALTGITSGRAQEWVTWPGDSNHGNTAVQANKVTTNIAVAKCFNKTPQLAIGPDADFVNKGGSAKYTVAIQNMDSGTCTGSVRFTPVISSETNTADFLASAISPTYVDLTAGQKGSVTLTVTSKATATVGRWNYTNIALSASGHGAPSPVTALFIPAAWRD
jgi:hypothetical protein